MSLAAVGCRLSPVFHNYVRAALLRPFLAVNHGVQAVVNARMGGAMCVFQHLITRVIFLRMKRFGAVCIESVSACVSPYDSL